MYSIASGQASENEVNGRYDEVDKIRTRTVVVPRSDMLEDKTVQLPVQLYYVVRLTTCACFGIGGRAGRGADRS
jgi:hypothetical protein